MKKRLTYGLLALWWLCISIPLVNQSWDLSSIIGEFKVKPLQGFQPGHPVVPFTWGSWFAAGDSSFQQSLSGRLQDSLRLRPYLTRLNNQVKFQLFGEVNARGIYLGEAGYFYEENNIRSYLGERFLGEDSIRRLVQTLKLIQDSLQANGVPLLFALAPGKASYLPQYLPRQFARRPRSRTNADAFREHLSQAQVPLLDYTPWFRQMTDTVSYPLFTRGGFHWSEYGVWLASDSLLKRMEIMLQRDMVDYEHRGNEVTLIPRGADHDIGAAANLLHEHFIDSLAYPRIHPFVEDSSKFRPRVLTIGDSYNWMLIGTYVPHRFYDPDWRFWYYHMQVWKLNAEENYVVPEIEDYRQELERFDFMLILFTEDNLYNGLWGFIPRAAAAYGIEN